MSSKDESASKTSLSRRNILLAGTTFAAATALSTATQTSPAQAQASSTKPPNILVIRE
jgi:arylsulfatase